MPFFVSAGIDALGQWLALTSCVPSAVGRTERNEFRQWHHVRVGDAVTRKTRYGLRSAQSNRPFRDSHGFSEEPWRLPSKRLTI